jgi:hypothetical protein
MHKQMISFVLFVSFAVYIYSVLFPNIKHYKKLISYKDIINYAF